MQNIDSWKPSKYIFKNGKLRASKDPNEVSISSRIIVDLVGDFYDEEIKNAVSGKLLDLGCGKVPLYLAYSEYTIENVCVDWGNTQHKNEFLDFEMDLNGELSFSDDEFDTVILSDVLEHIRYPEKLMKEINRILKKGGKLLLNVPFYYPVHEAPHDYFRYTKFALKSFAEVSNFRIVKLSEKGGGIHVLGDLFSKVIIVIPFVGRVLATLTHLLVKSVMKLELVMKLSEKTKSRFPLVICMIAEKV